MRRVLVYFEKLAQNHQKNIIYKQVAKPAQRNQDNWDNLRK